MAIVNDDGTPAGQPRVPGRRGTFRAPISRSNRSAAQGLEGVLVDPDAPTWETPTWADSKAFDRLYERNEIPMNGVRAAFDTGLIGRSEMEYINSGLGEKSQRTRFERMLGYHDHRGGFFGGLENFVGLLGTVSGYRFLVSSASAVLQGLKDGSSITHGDVGFGTKDPERGFDPFSKRGWKQLSADPVGVAAESVGGFGLAWSTEEFSRAWHGRTYYSEVFGKGGMDPGEGLMSMGFARGLLADVLLDPATWLTFGIGAATKVVLRGGSKGSAILSRNMASLGIKGADQIVNGGTLTLSRRGEAIFKIAGRHLINQTNRSARLKDVHSAASFKVSGTFLDDVYQRFGVTAETVAPEHVARMMEDPSFAQKFTSWVVENYEQFSLEHLDLMRGGAGDGVFNSARSAIKGDIWTPKGLASRADLKRGPAAMFRETAGKLGRDIGIPTDNIMGKLSRQLVDVNARAAEKVSSGAVNGALAGATKMIGWTAGVTHGAIETGRGFFTAAIERLPFEDRLATQAIFDGATDEMARSATTIRNYFDDPVRYVTATGQKVVRKISKEERQFISRHLEQPSMHPLPDHLRSAADWARQKFDDLFDIEKKWGISGEKLDHYVAHIYGNGIQARRMLVLRDLKMPTGVVSARLASSTVGVDPWFALHRKIATLDDAVEWFGKQHVELDIANILHRRAAVSSRMVAKQAARYAMVKKYGIGGMASAFVMEGKNFSKLLRAQGYVRNFVDPVGYEKVSKRQLERFDVLAAQLAKLDIDAMFKGKKGQKRALPESVARDADGKLIQKEVGGPKRQWFEEFPAGDELKQVKGRKHTERVKRNRSQMDKLTRAIYGKKIKDLTNGEADFLFDFIQGFVNPGTLVDRTGKFIAKKWRVADELVIAKVESGLIRTDRLAFGAVDTVDGLSSTTQRVGEKLAEVREAIRRSSDPDELKELTNTERLLEKELKTAQQRLLPQQTADIPFDQVRAAKEILKRRGVAPEGLPATYVGKPKDDYGVSRKQIKRLIQIQKDVGGLTEDLQDAIHDAVRKHKADIETEVHKELTAGSRKQVDDALEKIGRGDLVGSDDIGMIDNALRHEGVGMTYRYRGTGSSLRYKKNPMVEIKGNGKTFRWRLSKVVDISNALVMISGKTGHKFDLASLKSALRKQVDEGFRRVHTGQYSQKQIAGVIDDVVSGNRKTPFEQVRSAKEILKRRGVVPEGDVRHVGKAPPDVTPPPQAAPPVPEMTAVTASDKIANVKIKDPAVEAKVKAPDADMAKDPEIAKGFDDLVTDLKEADPVSDGPLGRDGRVPFPEVVDDILKRNAQTLKEYEERAAAILKDEALRKKSKFDADKADKALADMKAKTAALKKKLDAEWDGVIKAGKAKLGTKSDEEWEGVLKDVVKLGSESEDAAIDAASAKIKPLTDEDSLDVGNPADIGDMTQGQLRDHIHSIPSKDRAKELVKLISEKATDAALGAIVKHIGQYLGDTKVKIIEAGDTASTSLARGLAAGVTALNYDGIKPITISLRSPGLGGSGVNAETIAHELIHAATVKRTAAARLTANADTPLAKAYKDIENLMVKVNAARNKARGPKDPVIGPVTLTADELIAWGFTNEAFRSFLKTVKVEGTTVFNKFIEKVRNLLGLKKDSSDALTLLIDRTQKLLDDDLSTLEARGLKGRGEFLHTKGKVNREYSPQQIRGVVDELAAQRTKKGLSIGELERGALKRRVDELAGEATGLRKEAFKLAREAGKGAVAKAQRLRKRVAHLSDRAKVVVTKFRASERAEFKTFQSTEKAFDVTNQKIGRTEARIEKLKLKKKSEQEAIARKQARHDKLKKGGASEDELAPRAHDIKMRTGRLNDRLDRANALLKKQKARRDAIVKKADDSRDKHTDLRAGLEKESKQIEKDLLDAKAKVADATSRESKALRARKLRETRRERLNQASELQGRSEKLTKHADTLLEDINGTFILPKSFVDAVNDMMGSGFDFTQNHHKFLKAWQNFQKLWKTPLTLPFPEHHFRNALTNIGLTGTRLGLRMLDPRIWRTSANVAGYLLFNTAAAKFTHGAGLIPKGARKAIRRRAEKMKGEWETITMKTVDGRELNVADVAKEALARGINHGFVHSELGFSPFQQFDKLASGKLVPTLGFVWDMMTGSFKKGAAMTEQVFDVPFRIAMFTDEVLQGSTYDEAAEFVRAHLNDWTRLSNKEKVYMRTAMPFYSWYQFSLERAFKDMIQKPGAFVAPFKTAQSAQNVLLGSETPPNYQPSYMAERLGIWSPPNENGYYAKLVGFGLNQEEAFRQMSAMSDFARTIAHEGIGLVSKEAAFKVAPPVEAETAALRILSTMDFVSKGVAEFFRGRQFFDDAVTGSNPDMLLLGRSRLESGRGFEDLDKGFAANIKNTNLTSPASVVTLAAVSAGGKYLKEWLEYEGGGDPKSSRVSAYKRWLLGQTPASRFVQSYSKRVKHRAPGEVNYKLAALHTLGADIYRFHPEEGKYYRDRARIHAAALILRQAHMIERGGYFYNTGLPADADDPVTKKALQKLEKEVTANPRRRTR